MAKNHFHYYRCNVALCSFVVAKAQSSQIAANNIKIGQLSEQNKALEAQINDNANNQANLKKAISTAYESMPAKMSSNSILRNVLDLCDKHFVTAIPISTNDWTTIQIQQRPYSVYKMTLKLSGTETNLINCIQGMQSQLYPTLVIESLVFSQGATVPGPAAGGPTTITTNPSAAINIAIYAR